MGLSARARVDRVLSALADPRRRQIVELLRDRPRTAGEIARGVGMSPPALSRHLRSLRRSGLVAESHPEFDARVRVYALRPAPMAELKKWLEQTEQLWTEQMTSFRAHLERGK